MTYYQLNHTQTEITPANFLYQGENEHKNDVYISKTLQNYINAAKTEIDKYSIEWDKVKKITNPYEFIHTQIPNSKISISKYKPLSRSYFKFIELANIFSLITDNESNTTINSFHLAEGPGGFIEAMVNLRKNTEDNYYGMTLLNSDINVPGWHKSQHFLHKHSNVVIERGSSGDGDLLNSDNLEYVYNKYKNSMEIVSGDGGFDFSVDFNKQESVSAKLIFAQICYALMIQKKGGSFVLKFFDTFSRASVEMIYILNIFYDNVYIIKPCTSRYANSERYIVCKKFKKTNMSPYLQTFKYIIDKMSSNIYVNQLLNIELPYYYISRLEEINAILGQQQLESIISTLALIQNNSKENENKIEQITTNNIQKCNNWCIKNNIGFHKMVSSSSSSHDIFFEKRDNDYEKKYEKKYENSPENKVYVNSI